MPNGKSAAKQNKNYEYGEQVPVFDAGIKDLNG